MGTWGLSVHEGPAHVLYPTKRVLDTEHGQVPHALINHGHGAHGHNASLMHDGS